MIKLSNSKQLGMLAISMFLLTGLAGCNNDSYLNQAKRLSQNAEKLQTVYAEQASDYIESCYRTANHKLILPLSGDPFGQRQQALNDCRDDEVYQKAKQAFIAENAVIANYLAAIGNLAQDENFVLLGNDEKTKLENIINTQVKQRVEETDLISNINAGQAFSGLISFIYKQAAQDYASDDIAGEVITINPDLQRAICYFKLGWNKTYGDSLNDEEKEINTFYENTILQVIQKSNKDFEQTVLNVQNLRQILYKTSPDRGGLLVNYAAYPEIYVYDKQWQNELESLQQKKSALKKYVNVLNEIASGHAALEEASGGYGKGQETYCKGVTLSSSSNVNIMSSSQLKKDSIAPEQIDAYLTRVEKLLSEVQTLQTTSKK
jgi:hypothetical protein